MKNIVLPAAAAKARLSPADALMLIAIGACRADGALHPQELTHLRMLVHLNPLYAAVDNVDRYIERWAAFSRDIGTQKSQELAIAKLSSPLRETAYAWAVDVVYADNKQKQPEHSFLQALRAKLGIDGHLAGKIKAVTAIRNRFA